MDTLSSARHGIILLDKPHGISSNLALQRVRRSLGADKAGHSGTLDPMATGLLPIGIGHGTKALAYLLDADKRYVARVKLGQVTSTGDAEGEIISTAQVPTLSESLLQSVLSHLRGNIQQTPPMYSAIKQNGVRLYRLAREGQEVDRPSRAITILACELLSFSHDELSIQVWCSKGTYIRVLAEDIGHLLGCGAHLISLRRIGVAGFDTVISGQFDSNAWCPWSAVETRQELTPWLFSMDQALSHYSSMVLPLTLLKRLFSGQKISANDLAEPINETDLIRLYDDLGVFYGLGKATPYQGLMVERWMFDPLL